MKTVAREIPIVETAGTFHYRSWECGFCHTKFRMFLNDENKLDAVPKCCCNCGATFIDWKMTA